MFSDFIKILYLIEIPYCIIVLNIISLRLSVLNTRLQKVHLILNSGVSKKLPYKLLYKFIILIIYLIKVFIHNPINLIFIFVINCCPTTSYLIINLLHFILKCLFLFQIIILVFIIFIFIIIIRI